MRYFTPTNQLNLKDHKWIGGSIYHNDPELSSKVAFSAISWTKIVQENTSATQHMKETVAWGGDLFRRFCKLFSESSTGRWAVLQVPCWPSKQGELSTFRKHVTILSEQVAAPPSNLRMQGHLLMLGCWDRLFSECCRGTIDCSTVSGLRGES